MQPMGVPNQPFIDYFQSVWELESALTATGHPKSTLGLLVCSRNADRKMPCNYILVALNLQEAAKKNNIALSHYMSCLEHKYKKVSVPQ